MKNIIILSGHDPNKASGQVSLDIYFALSKDNNVKIITNADVKEPDEKIIVIKNRNKIRYFLAGLVRFISYRMPNRDKNYHFFSTDMFFNNIWYKDIIKAFPFKPDIILYLHPVKLLTIRDLFLINKMTDVPIFWYMMDMAPITGGCHYAWECEGYTKSCGKCPGLHSNNPDDVTHKMWKLKKKHIDKMNIIPIAGSGWQHNQLLLSSLFENKKKYKILLPINENIFLSGNKQETRMHFGLPQDKRIIFFGSVYLEERRKGFVELVKSLNLLFQNLTENERTKIHIAIAGKENPELESQIPFARTYLGYLDYFGLAKAFQAADFYICPSIEDSGPMMINQSIMCGTPVAAFKMGVAVDLVKTGVTGYQAKLKDIDDLYKGIMYLSQLPENELTAMSENCRNLGLSLLNMKTFSNELNEVINENKY